MGRGVSLLITLATQIVMVRGLTKEEFGSFAYAFALAVAGRQILSLGQGKMLSRFMAKYDEEHDFARMFGSMAVTGITICLTSALAFGAVVFLASQNAGSSSGLDYQILLVLFLLAPMEALDQVFVSLFAVFSKARSIIFRKYLFTPLLRLGVVVAMVALGASITFLAVGYVITGLLGLFVYSQLFVRELKKRELLKELHPRRLIYPAREMIAFSVPDAHHRAGVPRDQHGQRDDPCCAGRRQRSSELPGGDAHRAAQPVRLHHLRDVLPAGGFAVVRAKLA